MGDPVEIDSGHSWEDQRSTYDALRARCAVAREDGTWVVLRHAEVVAAATDPQRRSPAGSPLVAPSPTVSTAPTMPPTAPWSTAT